MNTFYNALEPIIIKQLLYNTVALLTIIVHPVLVIVAHCLFRRVILKENQNHLDN